MRRLRIICDTDKHTSEIIEAIAAFKPQYLIFAEEELDPKHRVDTLPRADEMPAGLVTHTERKAPELKQLPGRRNADRGQAQKQAEFYAQKKAEHNARLGFRPHAGGKLVMEPRPDGYGDRINIDATLQTYGITAKQLMQWRTDEGSDLAKLKAAIRMREELRRQR